jgi:hypothetical protein
VSNLDLTKLKLAIEYIDKLNASRKELEDETARRLGVDPEFDVVIITEKMLMKINKGWVGPLPKWIRTTNFVFEPYCIRGVRNSKTKFPKEEQPLTKKEKSNG